jgi:hypothetical protein
MDIPDPAPSTPLAHRRGVRIALITVGVVALFACCVCPGVALIYGNMGQTNVQATSTANASQQLSFAATYAAAATQDTLAATAQATSAVLQLPPTAGPVVEAPTATPKPKSHATPTATPKPHTSTPTATPNGQPTVTATPCPGVNCNPWGYNFTPPGNLITNPPGAFCNYFNCIATFSTGTSYVVECQDMTFSKTGQTPGSCSQNGGYYRTLYSH